MHINWGITPRMLFQVPQVCFYLFPSISLGPTSHSDLCFPVVGWKASGKLTVAWCSPWIEGLLRIEHFFRTWPSKFSTWGNFWSPKKNNTQQLTWDLRKWLTALAPMALIALHAVAGWRMCHGSTCGGRKLSLEENAEENPGTSMGIFRPCWYFIGSAMVHIEFLWGNYATSTNVLAIWLRLVMVWVIAC